MKSDFDESYDRALAAGRIPDESRHRAEVSAWLADRYGLDRDATLKQYDNLAPSYGLTGDSLKDMAGIRAHEKTYQGRVRRGGRLGDVIQQGAYGATDAAFASFEGAAGLIEQSAKVPTTRQIGEEIKQLGRSPTSEVRWAKRMLSKVDKQRFFWDYRLRLYTRNPAFFKERAITRDQLTAMDDAQFAAYHKLALEDTIAQAQVDPDKLRIGRELADKSPTEGLSTVAGAYREVAGEARQTNEDYYTEKIDPEFAASYTGQVVKGLGQMGFYVPVGLTGAGGLAAMGTASYQEAVDDYFDSQGIDKATATDDERARAAHVGVMYAIPAAALERVGLAPVLNRLFKATPTGKMTLGQVIKRLSVAGAVGFAAEGTTEASQTALQNTLALLEGYDPNREVTQDVLSSFIVGGVVGNVTSGSAQGLQEFNGMIDYRTSGETATGALAPNAADNEVARQFDAELAENDLMAGLTEPPTAGEFTLIGGQLSEAEIAAHPEAALVRAAFIEGDPEAQAQYNERFKLEPTEEMIEAQKTEEQRQREQDEAEMTLDGLPDPFAIQWKQETGSTPEVAIAVSALADAMALDKSRLHLEDGDAEALYEPEPSEAEQARIITTVEGPQSEFTPKDELQAAIKRMGGLPSIKALRHAGDPMAGDLAHALENGSRGRALSLTRKSAKDLDTLRGDLAGEGFTFETIDDMLSALQRSVGGAQVFPDYLGQVNELEQAMEAGDSPRSFKAARESVSHLVDKPLLNAATGMAAIVTNKSLKKMTSQSAVNKSHSPLAQAYAVSRIEQLFQRSLLLISHEDKKGSPDIAAIHRFYSPLPYKGDILIAKMTVKEIARADKNNLIYTLEAVDIMRPALESTDASTADTKPSTSIVADEELAGSDVPLSASAGLGAKLAEMIAEVKRKQVDELEQTGGAPSVTTEQDAAYQAAVESGDMATAQRLVDEAAKAAGYDTPKLYHGTGAEFTVFGNKGAVTEARSAGLAFFFTDDETTAKAYAVYAAEEGPIKELMREAEAAEARDDWDAYDAAIAKAEKLEYGPTALQRRENAKVVSVYLKGDWSVFNAGGKTPQELHAADIDMGISSQVERAAAAGKSGVIFKNMDDAIGLSGRPADHYAVFDSNQVKSAEAITRDESGAVIPLSERFNEQSDSILYQKGRKAKGKVSFMADGAAIITAFEQADVSTGIHELSHIARRWLFDTRLPQENRIGISDSDIAVAEEWAGAKDGVWTRQAEEKFARGLERYMRDGKFPTTRMRQVFEALSQWMKQIYDRVKGSALNVRITPEMRKVFDKLVTRDQAIAAVKKADPKTLIGADRLLAMKAQNATEDELFQSFEEEFDKIIASTQPAKAPNPARAARLDERQAMRDAIAQLEGMIRMLPLEVRGKIVGFGTLAQKVQPRALNKYLQDRRARIRQLLDDHLIKAEREKVETLVKDKLPKTEKGVLKGRGIDAEASATVKQVNHLLYMDVDELALKLEEIEAQAAANGDVMPEELADEYHLMGLFGGLLTPSDGPDTLQRWQQARLALEEIIRDGRTRWQAQEEARKAKMGEFRAAAQKTITGDNPLKTTERLRREKGAKRLDKAGLWDKLKKFDAYNSSFEWLLDTLSGLDQTSEQLKSFLNQRYVPMIHRANREEARHVREFTDMFDEKFRQLYGSKQAAAKAVFENRQTIDKTGIYTYTANGKKAIEIPMSQEEAAKKWMEAQDDTLGATFEAMHWTEETMEQLEAFLTPEMKAWAEWQLRDFYPQYHARVNQVYRRINGVDLPFNPNYTPIRRERGNAKTSDDLMREERVFSSVSNGSLKGRVANTRALSYEGATSTLMQHVQKMEHYLNYSDLMRELRSVLQSEEVATAIDQYHGDYYRGALNRYIDNFANGGVDRAVTIGAVDKVRAVATRGTLALNFPVLVKQLTSIPAYAINIPNTSFLGGLKDALAHPMKHLKPLYESDYFKQRWGGGYDRDIKFALSKGDTRLSKWVNQMMFMTRLGDAGAVLVGGLGVYQYHKQKALDAGKAEATAERLGVEAWETETRRMQQSGEVQDLGLIAQMGSWAKLFTMYSTAPNAYYRAEIAAIRNMLKGRISKKRALKQIAILHFILPGLFQFVANGFSAGLGDADGDEEKRNRMLRAMILGNANGLLIVGDFMNGLVDTVVQGNAFDLGNPVLDLGTQIIHEGIDIRKAATEDDIGMEEVLKMSDSAVEAFALSQGIPYGNVKNYISGLTAAAEGRTEQPVVRALGWSEYAVGERDDED